MTAAEPLLELGQALHGWHVALARGDRQARLAARLLAVSYTHLTLPTM